MRKVIEIPKNAYRVLITGDRNWTSHQTIKTVLHSLPAETIIIHGYADGADILSHTIAIELNLGVIPCPAHWNHNTFKWVNMYGTCPINCKEPSGKVAGILRNKYMFDQYSPHKVIGFHDNIYNSKGTKHMIKMAVNSRTPTELYTSTGHTFNSVDLVEL